MKKCPKCGYEVFCEASMANFNDARRHELLGLAYDPQEKYDLKTFESLSVETMKTLMAEGYLDKEDYQNHSPTASEFYKVMLKYPEVTAHGYIIAPNRYDCRITIEGLRYEGDAISEDMMLDLAYVFRGADVFKLTNNEFFCWYD